MLLKMMKNLLCNVEIRVLMADKHVILLVFYNRKS